MVKGSAIVTNERGIHARPSAELALVARSFKSKITLSYNNKTSDPTNVLQTIILEMFKGAEVEITADGEDEEEALEKIQAVLSKRHDYN